MQIYTKQLVNFFWLFIKQEKCRVFFVLLMPLIWCTAETFAPYLIKILLDKLVMNPQADFYFLVHISIIYIFLMISIEGALRLSGYLCIQIIPKIKEEIRCKTLTYIKTYSFSFFQSNPTGNLVTAFKNLTDSFEQCFISFVYGLYPITLTFFVSLILICTISKFFAFLFCLWYLGMNLITFFFYKDTLKTTADYTNSEIKLIGFIGDLLKNIILIKTFNSNKIDQLIMSNIQQETTLKSKTAEWVTFKADFLRGALSFIFLSLMFIFLINQWKKEVITIGDFSFITTICFYVRRSTWMATVQLLILFKNIGIAEQSFRLLLAAYKTEASIAEPPKKLIEGRIRFESIDFGYGNDKKIYKNFNLNIPIGQKVGMMGSSGSGKTTLIHLLLKLFEPENGIIYLDDYPVNNLSQEILNTYVSYVSQVPSLFHRSIYENIIYGNPSASFDEVIKASQACLCHDFVSRFEFGYSTIIGEEGSKISGGQRQRLALARAYLNNAPILILDEATSALDLATENKVIDAFLSQNKTMFVISHRTSILRKLDRILILEDGKIVKEGPPKEIL